ncbi:lytic transglycosylase domain-containing protein [Dictyobacter formicarum]|uniref:Transglycosylase SLT domain-containing protein n=1 Tax=Dictyobacter formicarum TaxID=2778368 RepID=A0ABQ3VY11_9CHLR|nr:lytic transglycosylase domain-containing protein [Dictyobacter formicarum]GHO89941.1 hypothetical protein KSZ_79470 [Dictyobacter formicarum]
MSPSQEWALYWAVVIVAGLAVLVTNRPYNPRISRILARNVFLLSVVLIAYHFVAVSFVPRAPAMAKAPAVVSVNYVSMARQDAVAADINPDLFVRQIQQESGFNPAAVSPAGAIGIAQFMPATAAGLGIDPHDPVQSLRAAAHLMSSYIQQYGSESAALAAYNAGPHALQRARSQCGDAWMSCLPAETQRYISMITG